jgi:hypothetical protein
MHRRWQTALPPFDGECIVTGESVSVEELRAILGVVVPELETGHAGQALYTFDDWHQHDGYINQRRVTDWGALAAVIRSADALIASRHGDDYVHRSFYPEDLSFLLRYDVSDESSDYAASAFSATFDLSAPPATIARVVSLVGPPLRSRLRVEPSKAYFDRTYLG